jgi:hypothetical protein
VIVVMHMRLTGESMLGKLLGKRKSRRVDKKFTYLGGLMEFLNGVTIKV